MLNHKDLFAKALMAEKPWVVHEIIFDQNTGKLDSSKINPHYVTHSKRQRAELLKYPQPK